MKARMEAMHPVAALLGGPLDTRGAPAAQARSSRTRRSGPWQPLPAEHDGRGKPGLRDVGPDGPGGGPGRARTGPDRLGRAWTGLDGPGRAWRSRANPGRP
jgi:hypothetical protein